MPNVTVDVTASSAASTARGAVALIARSVGTDKTGVVKNYETLRDFDKNAINDFGYTGSATADTDIVDGKLYYTLENGVYALVLAPVKADISNYYEAPAALKSLRKEAREALLHAGKLVVVGAEADELDDALEVLSVYDFNAVSFPSDVSADISAIIDWAADMHGYGKRFKLVLCSAPEGTAAYGTRDKDLIVVADHTGLDNEITGWVAGCEAGCELAESNSNRVYDGYLTVNGFAFSLEDRITLAANGWYVFFRSGDDVKVYEDVTTATDDFAIAQVGRIVDAVENNVIGLFNRGYNGSAFNNENNRSLFKSEVEDYLKTLVNIGAIEFDPDEVVVEAGDALNQIILTISGLIIYASMTELKLIVNLAE